MATRFVHAQAQQVYPTDFTDAIGYAIELSICGHSVDDAHISPQLIGRGQNQQLLDPAKPLIGADLVDGRVTAWIGTVDPPPSIPPEKARGNDVIAVAQLFGKCYPPPLGVMEEKLNKLLTTLIGLEEVAAKGVDLAKDYLFELGKLIGSLQAGSNPAQLCADFAAELYNLNMLDLVLYVKVPDIDETLIFQAKDQRFFSVSGINLGSVIHPYTTISSSFAQQVYPGEMVDFGLFDLTSYLNDPR